MRTTGAVISKVHLEMRENYKDKRRWSGPEPRGLKL